MKDYDYSQNGAYFVTICTQGRLQILGNICAFKSITTKLSNKNDNIKGRKIWHRSFHDHIIRNEGEYQKIWEYIDTNPLKWQLDCYHT